MNTSSERFIFTYYNLSGNFVLASITNVPKSLFFTSNSTSFIYFNVLITL